MTPEPAAGEIRWRDAALAACLFAVDPAGTGIALRARAGPARDRWLALLVSRLPGGAPVRRIPSHVTAGRLLGGLDLAATLGAGRPVAERGLLVEADGGIVLLAMAERLAADIAATLAAVLDDGAVALERDGLSLRIPTRVGLVALDEGIDADEGPPACLLDRCAFHLALEGVAERDIEDCLVSREDVAAARALLPAVRMRDEFVEALSAAGLALGIPSVRAVLLSLRVARAAAALGGREEVAESDAAMAARLVLGARATILPGEQTPAGAGESRPDESRPQPGDNRDSAAEQEDTNGASLDEVVLAAAQAAIPPDLLERLGLSGARSRRAGSQGRAGAPRNSTRHGRPVGGRPGALGPGARLNIIETLRAAAPWQRLRRGDRAAEGDTATRIAVRRDDFRIARFKARAETTIIFLVDASGSAALNRLSEAKGAVELVLAECYVRRDQVALIVFRGKGAELALPPTTSLARAKRSLAGVPGGGGTPVAAGIDAALTLAGAEARKGRTPIVVMMTDGKANVTRDGQADRPRAEAEALEAARCVRAAGLDCLLVDTAPRPERLAQNLAAEMRARYLALPYADAASLSRAVQTVSVPAGRAMGRP